MPKVLTPSETEAASGPAIYDAIRSVNGRLADGHRWDCVTPGIADAVAAAMSASGWDVAQEPVPGGHYVKLSFSARRD